MTKRRIASLCLAASGLLGLTAWLWLGGYWPLSAYNLSIVYTGKLMGELEPCGCAEETDLGGIKRQATMIAQLRRDDPNLVLISAGGLIGTNTWQDKIKAKYIFDALGLMRYDSVGIQWRDLAFGSGFIRSHDLRWVNSNSLIEAGSFKQLIRRNDRAVAHFSWLDPDSAQAEYVDKAQHAVLKDAERLNAALREAKNAGALTVVSTTVTAEELGRHVDLLHLDLLMTSSPDEHYGEPTKIGNTLIVLYGTRGMRIGKLDVELDNRQNIVSYRHSVSKLTKSISDSPDTTAWYDGYNGEVKAAYQALAEQRKQLQSNDNSFAGSKQCSLCHAGAHAVWLKTKHAKAFHTLESVSKQFDPQCIECHTVGFDKPGGFIDVSVSGFLTDVQCESCHGAAREHMSSGGTRKTSNSTWPAQRMCLQCHVGDHSPKFEFETYWPRIAPR